MTLSFGNTEVAFRSKSDAALRHSYWLFRAIEQPTLVKLGTWFMRRALQLHFPMEPLIKRTIFRQFCGGETIDECKTTNDDLSRFGIGTILDYSVEGLQSEMSFEETAKEILNTIERASQNPHIPFCVFKVTGIARFALLARLNGGEPPAPDQEEEWRRVRAPLGLATSYCASRTVLYRR